MTSICVLLAAHRGRIFANVPDWLVGVLIVAMGGTYLTHAFYARRNPRWRETAFWRGHRKLRWMMGGTASDERRGLRNEFVWAVLLLITGVAVLVTAAP